MGWGWGRRIERAVSCLSPFSSYRFFYYFLPDWGKVIIFDESNGGQRKVYKKSFSHAFFFFTAKERRALVEFLFTRPKSG
jgi:hypothetical protein